MLDHVHLISTPCDIPVERTVLFIKGGFSHALRQTGRNVKVWQKGFTDHRIRDAEDYEHHRKYLLLNPVRRGLCNAAEEYQYSSARLSYEVDPVPQRLKPLASGVTVRHG
jgi:putative transposase